MNQLCSAAPCWRGGVGAVGVRRYALSDEAFALVRDLLPVNGRRGGQWHDHRVALNGIQMELQKATLDTALATYSRSLAVMIDQSDVLLRQLRIASTFRRPLPLSVCPEEFRGSCPSEKGLWKSITGRSRRFGTS